MRARRFFLTSFLVSISRFAFAQGGPPMITDDPGTPGNGKWENNLAIAFSHVPNEWSIDAPAIDLNYGWGDHIQLTLQGGPALLKRSDHGLIGGVGGTEAAVKWRFLDEEKSGVDVSMFPRIIFNVRIPPCDAVWRKTARVSRSRFKRRRNLARSIWTRSSAR